MTIDIIIDLNSVEVRSRSPQLFVVGRIWFDIGGSAFPVEGWSDAPLSVLGSLVTALSLVAEDGEGDAYFFEGPLFVKFLAAGVMGGYPRIRVCGVRDTYTHGSDQPVGVIKAETNARLVDLVDCCELRVREFTVWASENGEREVSDVLGSIEARASSLRQTL
jgi:hypothetical protein